MKVLFLTSEGFDTPNSINHLCIALIEDLLKAGFFVHSISSHKTGKYSDVPENLLNYKNFSFSIIQRKQIDKNNFVKRYLDEIRYALAAKKIWQKQKGDYDAVILQSNPNSVFNALLLNWFMKKPIILNLYDVFPGHAMSIGVIKSKLVYSVLRQIQRILYRKCTYIVAMSEDMKIQLLKEKVTEDKIKVINNWFDNSVFTQISRKENRFFKKYNLDTNKFYVQFAGLLGYVFDYQMYLNVAERLQRREDIVFLLIGEGNQKNIILKEIKERNIKNIKYYPWQPLEIIADVYSACDIGLIPLKPGVIGNGIPSKACQLMAAKRVIINSVEKSDYTNLFDKHRMGINVVDHNPDSAVKAIEYLVNNRDEMLKIGQNAYDYSYLHYSRDRNTKKFIDLILSLQKK